VSVQQATRSAVVSPPLGEQSVEGGLRRRIGWGLADQVLSSGTNFALTLFAVAVLPVEQFGAFAVVLTVYGVCLGISAGLASSPLVVRYSAAASDVQRVAERGSVGAAALLGLVSGVLCLVAGAVAGGKLGPTLLALGVTLPGLLVQDAWRYAFMTEARPARAAVNDGVWTVLQAAGIGALAVADAMTAPALVLVWGGAATAAALFGCAQGGGAPALRRSWSWLREHRGLGPPYALEYVAHRSGLWAAVVTVGAISGLSTVAALRGALVLIISPLNLLFLAVAFVGVPEGARSYARDPGALPRMVRLIALGLAACALGWGAAVLAMPDAVGRRLLGETWHLAAPLMGIFVVLSVAQAISLGPGQGLRVLAAARRTLGTQLVGVALLLLGAPVGALVGGVRGAAVAMAVAVALTTAFRWQQFKVAYAQARRGVDPNRFPR
jgi:O-antigen/teichoic acid export membrane protein